MTYAPAILVVDDEPAVRALLLAALEPAGLRLLEAADGPEAIELAFREHPAVVLLDVGLPRLRGTDVCRALKTHTPPPAVILITGNTDCDTVADCGADAVIAKPFDPLALLDDVQSRLAALAAA